MSMHKPSNPLDNIVQAIAYWKQKVTPEQRRFIDEMKKTCEENKATGTEFINEAQGYSIAHRIANNPPHTVPK